MVFFFFIILHHSCNYKKDFIDTHGICEELTFDWVLDSTSTVSSSTRRRHGRTSTRRRRKRNRRTSSCWYRYHMAAPTNALREKTRSPPRGHFLSSCAETREIWIFFSFYTKFFEILLSFNNVKFTKYRSVATDTRIRSSPTRTFSPSDLCLEAGCTVHQHASPLRTKLLRISERITGFHSCFSIREKYLPTLLYQLFVTLNFNFILIIKSYNCV